MDGPNGWANTYYTYDGPNIVLERGPGAGDPDNRFLWGPAVDQLLATDLATSGADTDVLWPLGDHQGTIRDLAHFNGSSTTIYEHVRYDAYGNITADSQAAYDHLFTHTGRLFDRDTDLQYNLNRWYDPAVGRWMSHDPISLEGGDVNLYRYVHNSPPNGVDPDGLAEQSIRARDEAWYQYAWEDLQDIWNNDKYQCSSPGESSLAATARHVLHERAFPIARGVRNVFQGLQSTGGRAGEYAGAFYSLYFVGDGSLGNHEINKLIKEDVNSALDTPQNLRDFHDYYNSLSDGLPGPGLNLEMGSTTVTGMAVGGVAAKGRGNDQQEVDAKGPKAV